jgi:hypothetical protein
MSTSEQAERVEAANPEPCSACPWRLANQGTPHAGRWYGAKNLARLWSGLRRGERMTCHPTDPRMRDLGLPVSEEAVTHECTGSLVLVQREIMAFQNEGHTDVRSYARLHPRGLTRTGFFAIVSRALPPFPGEIPMARPNLNNAAVGYPPLGVWTPIADEAPSTSTSTSTDNGQADHSRPPAE